MNHNPLLHIGALPPFSAIKPEHIQPAIDELLAQGRALVAQLVQTKKNYTWERLIEPLTDSEDRLHKAWSVVSHLNAVSDNEQLRAAYNACLPKLSDYQTEMGQNKHLFHAYRVLMKSSEFASLSAPQQKILRNAIRDFRLSGIALDSAKRQRYKEIEQELSSLTSKFSENVLDATNGWTKLVSKQRDLGGLPETTLMQALQNAQAIGEEGWLLTLQFPCYYAVMTYADDRQLRREIYQAYNSKASEQDGGHWDNSLIMEHILTLRHEKARLLGFANYAELSLATKMANKPEEVIDFLTDLANKSWRQARNDFIELNDYAKQYHAVSDVQAWDMSYYSEKMRQHHYQLAQEEVKTYFPIQRVLAGLFTIVEKLYGMTITPVSTFDSWDKQVQLFSLHDSAGQLRGQFYTDLYARANKRGGAWMDDCMGRRVTQGVVQIPVAYLVCNFTPPTGNDPALLSHDEVITLFHEFGHCSQHLLTQVDYLGVAGINGVEWDAVELPSQFLENWCWDKHALSLISGHYQTGEPLPEALFTKMLAAKNFQAGMAMVRQLEFSLFDFRLHQEYDPEKVGYIYDVLEKVRKQVAVITYPSFHRMAHSFSHIFAGGYAAGYYSYKWAEVLSSDAFSLFEEKGIFDKATGELFLKTILQQGGSKNAMDLFIEFRGRKPEIEALLRHNGISV